MISDIRLHVKWRGLTEWPRHAMLEVSPAERAGPTERIRKMADAKTPATQYQVPDELTNWNQVVWDTKVAEVGDQIVFDTPGEDEFIGMYVGPQIVHQDDGDFTILQFIGVDGKPYQTNAGWKLEEAFKDIDPGTVTRILYVKNVDTGKKDPMKDFRVDVARRVS